MRSLHNINNDWWRDIIVIQNFQTKVSSNVLTFLAYYHNNSRSEWMKGLNEIYLKFYKIMSTFTGQTHSRGRVKSSQTCGLVYSKSQRIHPSCQLPPEPSLSHQLDHRQWALCELPPATCGGPCSGSNPGGYGRSYHQPSDGPLGGLHVLVGTAIVRLHSIS